MKTAPTGQTLTLTYTPNAVPLPPGDVRLVVRQSGRAATDESSNVTESAGVYRSKFLPTRAGTMRYEWTAIFATKTEKSHGKIDIFPAGLLPVSP